VEWTMERFEMDDERSRSQRVLGGWICGEPGTGFTRRGRLPVR